MVVLCDMMAVMMAMMGGGDYKGNNGSGGIYPFVSGENVVVGSGIASACGSWFSVELIT